MKDRRPPRKGGPQRGPKERGSKGAAPARFRKEGGARGPRDGGSEGSERSGQGRRSDGPRRPREASGDGGRFDRPTEYGRERSGEKRNFGGRGGAPRGRDFARPDRHGGDDRPSRGPRRPDQGGEPRDDRGGRFSKDAGAQEGRRFERGGGDGRRQEGRSADGERRFAPKGPRRENGPSNDERPGSYGGRNARSDGERPEGARRYERKAFSGPRTKEQNGERFEREDRPRGNWRGEERHEGRAPRGGLDRAPRGGKPKPGAEQRIVGREKARRAQSLGEDGALWLYGKHAVAAALANPQRKIKRLLAAEGALAWLAAAGVDKERAANAEETSTEEIDLLLHQGAVHQGLAALVEDIPRARLREECTPEGRAPVVVLDQITDPQNIGAIMRSAAAFGAKAVVVQDRRTPPLAGALAKAAAGAVEQIACVKVVNVARAVEGLKDLGYYCAGLAGDAEAPVSDIPKDRPVALVLGAEGEGLRRLVAETCDGLYKIPIVMSVDSLNVSNAAAVSLYAVTR